MLRELNRTNIVLIPKVKSLEYVSQFYPINLCNFVYKIISKVLVNHLKSWLSSLISPMQSAFASCRQIQDNFLVAHETFHALRTSRKKEKIFMVVKLNMNKAYNCVEWDFLREALKSLRFAKKWVVWVCCVVRPM